MKSLKKLALVSAMIAASSSAFAMEAMDEEALSAMTGQEGITIQIDTPALTLSTIIHDNDGLGADTAGAIVIGDPLSAGGIQNTVIATGAGGISLVIDAAEDAVDGAYLNIGVNIAAGTTIQTGDISVAVSNGVGTPISGQTATILESSTITLGATSLNIQLGNEPQGAMIAVNTVMTNGLSIANFALNDASSGESISIANLTLRDAVGTNLTVGDVTVDVEAAGLVVAVNSIGTGGLYQSMTGVTLGSAPAIGDIEIIGLNLNGTTLTISGH